MPVLEGEIGRTAVLGTGWKLVSFLSSLSRSGICAFDSVLLLGELFFCDWSFWVFPGFKGCSRWYRAWDTDTVT